MIINSWWQGTLVTSVILNSEWTSSSPSKFCHFNPCYVANFLWSRFSSSLFLHYPSNPLCLKWTKLYLFLATKTTHLKLGVTVGTKFGKFTGRKKLMGFDDYILIIIDHFQKLELLEVLHFTTNHTKTNLTREVSNHSESPFPAKLRRQ